MTNPKNLLSKQLREQLAARAQPELTAEVPVVPCGVPWCRRLDNCDECAERRELIDEQAGQSSRGAGEIREDVRRSWRQQFPASR